MSLMIDVWHDIPWMRLILYLILCTLILGNLSTYLRSRFGWADGYSRKLNHVGIMGIAVPLFAFLPPRQLLPSVFIAMTALVAIYAIAALSTRPRIHGIVAGSLRKTDGARSRFFFLMPFVTCNVALGLSVLVYPIDIVRIAFLTVAFADGIAEPIGLRFGRTNSYRVKDPIWRCYNTKSVAGSASVFVLALIIILVSVLSSHELTAAAVLASAGYAAVVTAIEAVSPRGLDNTLLVLLCPIVLLMLAPAWS